MLVAMVLLALLAVMGTSTMNIAGIDQRIAYRNRQHAVVVHTSHAGTEHARDLMRESASSLLRKDLISMEMKTLRCLLRRQQVRLILVVSRTKTASGVHNLGVYVVDAVYLRCGNPPPGYSTEQGRNGFRSDYWEMESIATMTDTSYSNMLLRQPLTR